MATIVITISNPTWGEMNRIQNTYFVGLDFDSTGSSLTVKIPTLTLMTIADLKYAIYKLSRNKFPTERQVISLPGNAAKDDKEFCLTRFKYILSETKMPVTEKGKFDFKCQRFSHHTL